MDLFNEFAVDAKRLIEGVWHVFTKDTDRVVPESEVGDQVAVLIASTDNPSYRHDLQKRMRAMQTRRGLEVDPKAAERMTAEIVADHIVKDWRNWVIRGEVVPYSRDLVITIWTDPTWINLKNQLLSMIGEQDAYRVDQEETVLKN